MSEILSYIRLRGILRRRLLFVLVALLAVLFLFPYVYEEQHEYVLVLEFFLHAILIAAIFVVHRHRRFLTISILVALLAFTVIAFNVLIESTVLLRIGLLLEIIFFLMAMVAILRYTLHTKRISEDKIYGAISAYLLLGLVWAVIYSAIENIHPGAFFFAHGVQIEYQEGFAHKLYVTYFMYYSFITLTTLGYGDILPISNIARIFSSLEAIVGQLYVAVLIARLVALHVLHGMKRS